MFIPISGWMANRFGTRRVFSSAIGVFTLGSFLCGISTNIHWLVACRILQGCGGAMMLPVGRLTLVRTFAKSELIRAMSFVAIPGLIGPMLGPLLGGLIVGYFHWSVIFFVNIPIGILGSGSRVPPSAELSRGEELSPGHRRPGAVRLRDLAAILCARGVRRAHPERPRDRGAAGDLGRLLGAYGLHSVRTAHPLLRLGLMRIRSFRVSISGNMLTRLGIGGLPFLLPLLYQVGLGFTPIQSGPHDHAAGAGGHQLQVHAAASSSSGSATVRC